MITLHLGDITTDTEAVAIVNAANESLLGGGGGGRLLFGAGVGAQWTVAIGGEIGGAGALILASRVSWPGVYWIMAALMIAAIAAAFAAPEPERQPESKRRSSRRRLTEGGAVQSRA